MGTRQRQLVPLPQSDSSHPPLSLFSTDTGTKTRRPPRCARCAPALPRHGPIGTASTRSLAHHPSPEDLPELSSLPPLALSARKGRARAPVPAPSPAAEVPTSHGRARHEIRSRFRVAGIFELLSITGACAGPGVCGYTVSGGEDARRRGGWVCEDGE